MGCPLGGPSAFLVPGCVRLLAQCQANRRRQLEACGIQSRRTKDCFLRNRGAERLSVPQVVAKIRTNSLMRRGPPADRGNGTGLPDSVMTRLKAAEILARLDDAGPTGRAIYRCTWRRAVGSGSRLCSRACPTACRHHAPHCAPATSAWHSPAAPACASVTNARPTAASAPAGSRPALAVGLATLASPGRHVGNAASWSVNARLAAPGTGDVSDSHRSCGKAIRSP
jgi:hypothetical protein